MNKNFEEKNYSPFNHNNTFFFGSDNKVVKGCEMARVCRFMVDPQKTLSMPKFYDSNRRNLKAFQNEQFVTFINCLRDIISPVVAETEGMSAIYFHTTKMSHLSEIEVTKMGFLAEGRKEVEELDLSSIYGWAEDMKKHLDILCEHFTYNTVEVEAKDSHLYDLMRRSMLETWPCSGLKISPYFTKLLTYEEWREVFPLACKQIESLPLTG